MQQLLPPDDCIHIDNKTCRRIGEVTARVILYRRTRCAIDGAQEWLAWPVWEGRPWLASCSAGRSCSACPLPSLPSPYAPRPSCHLHPNRTRFLTHTHTRRSLAQLLSLFCLVPACCSTSPCVRWKKRPGEDTRRAARFIRTHIPSNQPDTLLASIHETALPVARHTAHPEVCCSR